MSYNSETGIISAPVSIDDVKQALGESSNDLATLCTYKGINMWAKYKPVDSDNAFLDINTGWKGKRNDCNINYPKATNIYDIKGYYSQANNGFTYRTASAPYRLGDFRGYNHNARSEYLGISTTSPSMENEVSIAAAYNVQSVNSDWISMKDLLNDGNNITYHFGVLLYNNNGNKLQYMRTSHTDVVYFTKVKAGIYTVYPFMSSVDYSSSDFPQLQVGSYIPIPVLQPITLVVKTKTDINASKVTLSQSDFGSATIENVDKVSHVVSLQLRFSSSKETSSMMFGEAVLINNIKLASGDSKTVLFKNKMLSGKSYALWLYVDRTLTINEPVFTQGIIV
jgi:hypothetical protein